MLLTYSAERAVILSNSVGSKATRGFPSSSLQDINMSHVSTLCLKNNRRTGFDLTLTRPLQPVEKLHAVFGHVVSSKRNLQPPEAGELLERARVDRCQPPTVQSPVTSAWHRTVKQ